MSCLTVRGFKLWAADSFPGYLGNHDAIHGSVDLQTQRPIKRKGDTFPLRVYFLVKCSKLTVVGISIVVFGNNQVVCAGMQKIVLYASFSHNVHICDIEIGRSV